METIKTVKSFKKCKPYVFYKTTNYKLFKKSSFNRGEEGGVDLDNVKRFKKIMNNSPKLNDGDFMDDLQHIAANVDGLVHEGHTRLTACEELKRPVIFVLYDSKHVNGVSDIKRAEVLIKFNNIDPRWKPMQIFRKAVGDGYELALEMKVVINDTIKKINDITRKKTLNWVNFGPNKIIGILREDAKYLHGKKLQWEDFQKEELIKKIYSDDFKSDLSFMASVMNILSNDSKCKAEVREVLMRLFKAIWNEDVSRKNVYTYLYKYGFNCKYNDADSINDRIDIICKKRFNANDKVSWV